MGTGEFSEGRFFSRAPLPPPGLSSREDLVFDCPAALGSTAATARKLSLSLSLFLCCKNSSVNVPVWEYAHAIIFIQLVPARARLAREEAAIFFFCCCKVSELLLFCVFRVCARWQERLCFFFLKSESTDSAEPGG